MLLVSGCLLDIIWICDDNDIESNSVCFELFIQFWCELSREGRQELLRIDRQAVLEQARKNMCCSKCICLLLEDFLQIVSNGKQSLQHKGDLPCNRSGALRDQSKVVSHRCSGELQDPGVHLWGGLTATRDGLLTVLDCYLYAKSFKGLQNVSFIQGFLIICWVCTIYLLALISRCLKVAELERTNVSCSILMLVEEVKGWLVMVKAMEQQEKHVLYIPQGSLVIH